MKYLIIIMTFVIYGVNDLALAQQHSEWSLPPSTKNTRWTSDYFNIPRPALSLRGFDNQNLGIYENQYSDKIFGVKQLIEKLYSSNLDTYWKDLLQFHYDQSVLPLSNDANKNSAILESKALMALISYVISKNNGVNQPLNGKTAAFSPLSHQTYRNNLISDLTSGADFIRDVSIFDAFKRGKSLMRLARAWDLYLALENAYLHYGEDMSALLTRSQKEDINFSIHYATEKGSVSKPGE